MQRKSHRIGPVVEYNLYINDTTVNFTGRKRKALAINGQIPAPTLHFTEGDSAVIHVHNGLRSEVSIHWHGVLLPNEADGVPYLTTPPIKAGQTHTFRFRIIQHGTLWYHSHSAEQEQEGLYGPLVFYPADDTNNKSNEEVLQISDWRDEGGKSILRSLKRRNEWYAIKKKSVQSWGEAIFTGHFSDKVQMEWMRMPGADVSDVYYNRFLMHGQPVRIIDKYKKGDSVRLRIINGSAASYFWLQYSGGKMKVIAADGNNVVPVEVDKLLIATAETYDVIIKIPGSGQYEFRATAQDITGYASAFFGSGTQVKAKDIPRLDYMVLMNEMNKMTWMMKGMGMKMKMGLYMKMPEMNMNNMGGMGGMQEMDTMKMKMNMDSMEHEKMNRKDTAIHNMDSMEMKNMDHSKMPGMDTTAEKKKPVKAPVKTTKKTIKKPVSKQPAKKKPATKKQAPPKPVDHSKHGTSFINKTPSDNYSKMTGISSAMAFQSTYITSSYLKRFISENDTVPKKDSMVMPMNEHAAHQQKMNISDTVPPKKNKKEVDMKMDTHTGMNNMQGMQMSSMQHDTSRSAMLMNMMPKMKMTGFDFPPGNGDDVVLSYDMLVSDTGSTALPKDRPWREINLTLSGNMQRFVWSVNGKTLSTQDEKVLIRRGENVRLVFTNATMMEHPMHLHGHFFRVINKQGGYAPMKHTFNINAMTTQVIEFAATEEKDWFLHCHTLYHMMSGMATIISYEGTESQVQKTYHHEFKMFKKEHGSMIFAWANASAHSQGAFGTVVLSSLKFLSDIDWKYDWKKSYEFEPRLQYFLDKRQFLSVFAGADLQHIDSRDGKFPVHLEDKKVATLGLIYTLPFLINAEGRIDHTGKVRLQLRREDFPLTTRTRLDFYWNTEHEYGIAARYIIAKYLAISANYDNEFGWGAGISLIY